MRLKSRDKWVPGGFQMIHPEAGQKKPWSGSFSEIVHKELDFRQRNPAITQKNGWSLDPDIIASDVDIYNARRMVAGGYLGFVELEADPPAPQGGTRRSAHGAGVAAVNTALTGLAIYRELFTTSKPVVKEEAERRAAICAVCPKNKPGGFKEWFVSSVAKGLTELVGIMLDLDLTTSHDADLGTCAACHCPMKAKVFVELPIIHKHLKPDEQAALDSKCWILPVGS